MKKILLLVSLFIGLPVWADDATATNASASPSSMTEKQAALAINTELKGMLHGGDSSDTAWQAVDAKIDGYQKQYGVTSQTTKNVVLLRTVELFVAKKSNNPARYDALVQKIAADPLPEVSILTSRIANLKTKPIDLQFTAMDGSSVDLSKMTGKVVLIDFWATWCGPCVAEVPDVVAAYQKYHNQGLEIVGISLDSDKSALLNFTKTKGMVWPQYFDGKGWSNAISSSYGIHSIPAMWLVGKNGMLVTMDGRDQLDAQIQKLLQAP